MMKCAHPRFFVHTTCFFLVCHSWFDIPITIEDIPSEESTQYLLAWIVLFIVVSLTVAKVRMAGVVGEGSTRHSQSPAASPTHHPHLPSPKAFYMARVHNDEGSHESSATHSSHAYMAWERWSTTAASLMLAGRFLKFFAPQFSRVSNMCCVRNTHRITDDPPNVSLCAGRARPGSRQVTKQQLRLFTHLFIFERITFISNSFPYHLNAPMLI